MGVDRRHDHSFRVPRPDLTERFGVPNACTSCHAGKTPAWASAALDALADTEVAAAAALRRDVRGGARRGGPMRVAALAAHGVRRAPAGHGPRLGHRVVAVGGPAAARRRRSMPWPVTTIRSCACRGAGTAAPRAGGARPRRRPPARGPAAGHSRRCRGGPRRGARGLAAGGAAAGARAQTSPTSGPRRPSTRIVRSRTSTWRCSRRRRGNVAAAMAEYEAAIDVRALVPAGLRQSRRTPAAGRERGDWPSRRCAARWPLRPTMPACCTPSACRRIASSGRATRWPCWRRRPRPAPEVPRYPFAYALALESQGRLPEALKVIDAALVRHPGQSGPPRRRSERGPEVSRCRPRARVRAPPAGGGPGRPCLGPVGTRASA